MDVRKAVFMLWRIQTFILLFFLIVPAWAGTQASAPSRALFVSVIDHAPALASRQGIDQLITFADEARIKTLFVQIYRANRSWFPSKVSDQTPYDACLKSVGTDPLALLIQKAHARGIEVHAWLNLLSLSTNVQAPILKKYGPDILTKDLTPKKTIQDYRIDSQYFLEPGDLRVRVQLGEMVEEIVERYPDLDGIQFDYIRYPDFHPIYGFTPMNIRRFKEATGTRLILNKDPAWQNWKRAQVTDLLKMLIQRVRAVRPRIHISTTGCMSYSRAYNEAFQDWPSWVNSGLVEFVTVMSYPNTADDFRKDIADAMKRVQDPQKIKLGVGAYKFVATPDVFMKQFDMCEKTGVSACAVFHYGSIVSSQVMRDYLIAPAPGPAGRSTEKAPF